jgi:hypothetical protein
MNGPDHAGHPNYAFVTTEGIEEYRKSIQEMALKSAET